MNYNILLSVFGLDPNDFKPAVSDPYVNNGTITMMCEQRTDINRICPFCLSTKIVIKDYDEVILRATINANQKSELLVRKVRFKCKNCLKTFTPKLNGILKGESITSNVKKMLYLDFQKKISFSSLAALYNMSVTQVINTFDELYPVVYRGAFGKVLCIDEFHFSQDIDQNYCCGIVDFEKKELIDIIKNRRKEYLDSYFSQIDKNELNKVQYFISDLYDEYALIRKKYFSNAIHIADRFHITTQLTRAINKRRNIVMKQCKNTHPILNAFMKKNWELFEVKKDRIPNKFYKSSRTELIYSYETLLYESLKLDYSLNVAYFSLQDLLISSYKKSDVELENFFIKLADRLISTNDDEFIKVGKTYKKWLPQIVNAYKHESVVRKYTNAIAESLNNTVKTLIKISYGLINFERMRKRVLIITRNHKKEST